jgi:hypothetical protein
MDWSVGNGGNGGCNVRSGLKYRIVIRDDVDDDVVHFYSAHIHRQLE